MPTCHVYVKRSSRRSGHQREPPTSTPPWRRHGTPRRPSAASTAKGQQGRRGPPVSAAKCTTTFVRGGAPFTVGSSTRSSPACNAATRFPGPDARQGVVPNDVHPFLQPPSVRPESKERRLAPAVPPETAVAAGDRVGGGAVQHPSQAGQRSEHEPESPRRRCAVTDPLRRRSKRDEEHRSDRQDSGPGERHRDHRSEQDERAEEAGGARCCGAPLLRAARGPQPCTTDPPSPDEVVLVHEAAPAPPRRREASRHRPTGLEEVDAEVLPGDPLHDRETRLVDAERLHIATRNRRPARGLTLRDRVPDRPREPRGGTERRPPRHVGARAKHSTNHAAVVVRSRRYGSHEAPPRAAGQMRQRHDHQCRQGDVEGVHADAEVVVLPDVRERPDGEVAVEGDQRQHGEHQHLSDRLPEWRCLAPAHCLHAEEASDRPLDPPATLIERMFPRSSERRLEPRRSWPTSWWYREPGAQPKGIDLDLPATSSSSSPGCPARASRRSRSTRSMPRASAATSSRCRPTPASSSGRWTSPTSTSSRACRRRSPSTRSRHPQPAFDRGHHHRGLRLPPPALRPHRRAALPDDGTPSSPARRRSRSSTASSSCRRAPASRCWPRWCGPQGHLRHPPRPTWPPQGFARAIVDGELHELGPDTLELGVRRAAHDPGGGRPPGPTRATWPAVSPTLSRRPWDSPTASPRSRSFSNTYESGTQHRDVFELVEGAERQKTPNEIALNILLIGLTIIFVFATATIPSYVIYAGGTISVVDMVALFVTLIPTTIGALLSAIGIAGMDRLVRFNVLAMSGRAVEAAGDVDTLLLDKTGTITLGNRQATAFRPVKGVTEQELADAAQLASLSDETPEGRSIVVLAKEKYGIRSRELAEIRASFIPFTAQTRMSGVDIGAAGYARAPSMRREFKARRLGLAGGASACWSAVALKRFARSSACRCDREVRRHAAGGRQGRPAAGRRSNSRISSRAASGSALPSCATWAFAP